jgi:hypothetical protein
MWGGGGSDSLVGGSGTDTFVTLGGSDDTVVGGAGFDTFWINPGDVVTNVSAAESALGAVHQVAGVPALANEPTIGMGGVTYQDFSADPLFSPAGPTPNDVVQGDSGDCYFLASVAAIAQANPNEILQTIVEMADNSFLVQFGASSSPTYVHVDAQWPAYTGGSLTYAQLGADNSLWVAILEKAFAVYRNGADSYPNIYSGWMSEVFNDFGLNNSNVYTSLESSETAFLDQIQTDVAAGDAVTAGVVNVPSGLPLVGDHAYTITSVTVADGVVTGVTLRNPWGTVGVDGLSNGGYLTLTADQAFAGLYCISAAVI